MIQVHPYPSHCIFIHSSALSSIPVHFRNPGALYCIPVHSHDLSALSYITSPIFFVKCKFKLAESCHVSSSSNSPALPQAKFKLACTTSSHSPLTTSSLRSNSPLPSSNSPSTTSPQSKVRCEVLTLCNIIVYMLIHESKRLRVIVLPFY